MWLYFERPPFLSKIRNQNFPRNFEFICAQQEIRVYKHNNSENKRSFTFFSKLTVVLHGLKVFVWLRSGLFDLFILLIFLVSHSPLQLGMYLFTNPAVQNAFDLPPLPFEHLVHFFRRT